MKLNDLANQIFEYLYDYLNNAATCLSIEEDRIHVDIDAFAKFDLILDLSNAKYFNNDTMQYEELEDDD